MHMGKGGFCGTLTLRKPLVEEKMRGFWNDAWWIIIIVGMLSLLFFGQNDTGLLSPELFSS